MCANCRCPRENHDVSVDVDVDGVEFKVKGLKINADANIDDEVNEDTILPPPPPQNNKEYTNLQFSITTNETTPVDNDFLPPPPALFASDYLWSPEGLTAGQVRIEVLLDVVFL